MLPSPTINVSTNTQTMDQYRPSPCQVFRLPPPPSRRTHHNNIPRKQDIQLIEPQERTRETLLPPVQRTNGFVWLLAFLCVIFSIIVILAGIITLVIFVVIKPKHPLFDITSASLNSIYLDTPEYFNGDFTFLANFSNPNRKINIKFEYLSIDLYFFDRLIGTQAVQPFAQRSGETRLEAVHLISSEIYLSLNLSMELQRQVQSNRVQYNIRGTFRIRASLGLSHYSYWLYGRCWVELTGPPTGVLISRNCVTKK